MKTKYCIDSVVPFKHINESHTNRSKTKQTFSFSKSSRFEDVKPQCLKNTYGGDFIKRKGSATGIGYGKRSDFTKCLAVSPQSTKYNMRTIFDENRKSKKGFTMALSREKIQFQSYINKQVTKFPSATKYHNEKDLKTTRAPIYTMRKKTSMLDKTRTIEAQNTNPGPGLYENNPENYTSKEISKYNRVSYSSNRQKRFQNSDNKIPGPGSYNDVSNLSNVGRYVISTHLGGTNAKFDKTKRVTRFDEVKKEASPKPGPGYYRVPSEFGQYDGDVYNAVSYRKAESRKKNH